MLRLLSTNKNYDTSLSPVVVKRTHSTTSRLTTDSFARYRAAISLLAVCYQSASEITFFEHRNSTIKCHLFARNFLDYSYAPRQLWARRDENPHRTPHRPSAEP